MSTQTLAIVAKTIGVLNGLISLTANAQQYRAAIADAIKEGRDLTEDELDILESQAYDAIAEARKD